MTDHIIQGRAVLDGKLHGGFDRLVADLAGRRVDDAAQTELVRRVLDHPQVGEHVLDLGAREEVAALVHAVRNARADECGGNVIRQDIVAVQNGEISPFSALLHALADGVRDVGSLALLAVRAMQTDFRTVTVVGPQFLALAADVVADNLVCGIQNVAGRAVILFQTDGFRVLELLFKLQNIRDRCTAELVDTLVVIADHADVLIITCQQAGEHILRVVGILILVHENIAELALIVFQHLGVVLQQQHGFHDNVVEIQRTGLFHGLFVIAVDVCDLFTEVVTGGIRAELTRGHQLVLRAGDHAHHGSRIEILGIEIELFHYVENDALLVVLIVDGERALKAEQINMLAQDAQAGCVEGVCPDSGRGFLVTKGKFQTLAQFTRSLIRERDRNHLPWASGIHRAQVLRAGAVLRFRIGQVFGQEQKIVLGRPVGRIGIVQSIAELENVDDAVDEHGRLAAACTRQNEQRTLGLIDSLALLVV